MNPMDGLRSELRATLALALPLAAANLAQMAMAVTNTVMVGRLGAMPLAAAGLGGMLYFTGGVTLQGVLSAVAPLAAHALGAGDRRAAGRSAGAGLVLAVVLALPFTVALISLDRLLAALGYDAALAAEIGRYLRAIAWAAPAFLGFAVLRSLLAALSHTRSVMAVVVICIAGNALLNWVLIFGHLGAPALGMAGSGYASAINQWLMLAGLALCARIMPDLAALAVLRNAFAARRIEMAEILRLGLPIGANVEGHATAAPGAMLRLRYALSETGEGVRVMGQVGAGIMRNTIKLDGQPAGKAPWHTVQDIINAGLIDSNLHAALMAVAANRSGPMVSSDRLGRWLRKNEGKIHGKLKLACTRILHGYPLWTLVRF